MPPHTLLKLLGGILPDLHRNARLQGAHSSGGVIRPETSLAISLRILSEASYLILFLRFTKHIPHAKIIFHDIIRGINRNLPMPRVPVQNEEFLPSLSAGFQQSRQTPSPLLE